MLDAFWENANYDLGPNLNEEVVHEKESLEREMESAELWCDERFGNVVGMDEDSEEERERQFIEQQDKQMLADMLSNAAINDHALNNILYGSSSSPSDRTWSPYDSKAMCILDLLDNIPRVCISTSLMKSFIWALHELGVPNTPSFYSLRKTQERLRKSHGISNIECKSVQGKVFYINDIRDVIANLFREMGVYPKFGMPTNGTRLWILDILSPMYDAGTKHYYIHELACQADGSLVIPIRWVIENDQVCADAYAVFLDDQGKARVDDTHSVRIKAQNLTLNLLDLEHCRMVPVWSASATVASFPSQMPNKYRAIAQGDPLYVSFIDYFGDDVSGNRSKSWNKHNNSYITHRNLPHKLLQQEYHIHLISTSQHTSIAEQYHDVKKLMDSTRQDPVKVVNSEGLITRFIIQPHSGPADNPAQSDVASHIGSAGNHPCRKCDMGGPEVERAKGKGFHAVFNPGAPRTKDSIRTELEKQLVLACNGETTAIKTRQTNTGTKDAYTQFWIEDLLRRYNELRNEQTDDEACTTLLAWVREHESEIYDLFLTTQGFDPARDTPVEILHTILLGVVKYIWHYSTKKWTSSQKAVYAQRLQATNTDGLLIAEIQAEYIIQYSNSLNGRQFRQVVQTAVFHIYDLVDEDHFIAWKAVGHLAALLWQVEIDDVERYCHDVKIATGNIQDAFAVLDPTKMLGNSSYIYLDTWLRIYSSLALWLESPPKALNCTTVSSIGNQENMKHRLSGGSWYDAEAGKWTQAGDGVCGFLRNHRVLQTMLGWSKTNDPRPGSFTPIPVGQRPKGVSEDEWAACRHLKLQDSYAQHATNASTYLHEMTSTWIKCRSVVATSRETCTVSSWVFYTSPFAVSEQLSFFAVTNGSQSIPAVGRIIDILAKDNAALVILEEFSVSPERDPYFWSPIHIPASG
ncbi:hypothetical protein AAF712_013056 [Marasmius tenuissimus]|uniref:Uncharacterized protein n=1 Tax=Marasmius tenuissimus TaxID=585030 RepID=A0ABR2ZIA5_9AGAR